MTEVLTSMRARLYGRRSAANRARRALEAAAGISAKVMVSRLRLSPEKVDGLLAHGHDPVAGLRATLPEEFHRWYETAAAQAAAKAGALVARYERLAAQASSEAIDGSDRAYAEAAQRLAGLHGLHPGPLFAIRRGRLDVLAGVWAQTRPAATADRPPTRQPQPQPAAR